MTRARSGARVGKSQVTPNKHLYARGRDSVFLPCLPHVPPAPLGPCYLIAAPCSLLGGGPLCYDT
jgi:hypothetical protein